MYLDFIAAQVLGYLYDGSLGVLVKKDFDDVIFHLQKLKIDIERVVEMESKKQKSMEINLMLDELEKMFYPIDKVNAISWDSKTIESIEYCISELVNTKETLRKYGLNLKRKGK